MNCLSVTDVVEGFKCHVFDVLFMPNDSICELGDFVNSLNEDHVLVNVMRDGFPTIPVKAKLGSYCPTTTGFGVNVKVVYFVFVLGSRMKLGYEGDSVAFSQTGLTVISLDGVTSGIVNGVSTFFGKELVRYVSSA